MKQLLLSIFMSCSVFAVKAQISLTNQFIYASPQNESINGVDLSWDHNMLAAQTFYADATNGLTARFQRMPLTGFSGNTMSFGNTGVDEGIVAKPSHTGYVFYAGHFTHNVNFSNTTWWATTGYANNGKGAFIARYDTSGIPTSSMVTTIVPNNTSSSITLNDMETDALGNFYVVGNFTGAVTFSGGAAGGVKTAAAYGSVFFAKYNQHGNCQWVAQLDLSVFPGMGNTIALNAIDLDETGNIYVAGKMVRTIDYDPGTGVSAPFANYGRMFVGKYDNNGNYLGYVHVADGVNLGQAFDVVAKNGFVYVTGVYGWDNADFDPSTGTAILPSGGFNGNMFIAKYTTDFEYVWAKNTIGDGAEIGRRLDVDASGNVYTLTTYNGPISLVMDDASPNLTFTSRGSNDLLITKYNSLGAVDFAKQIGGNGNDVGNAIALTPNGDSLFVGGSFTGTINLNVSEGSTTFTTAGGSDGFVAIFSLFADPMNAEMGTLTGSLDNQSIANLSWETYSEMQNAGFEIQKSPDGKSFTTIAKVASKYENGTGSQSLKYEYLDQEYSALHPYYRIKQNGQNGTVKYSNVIKVYNQQVDSKVSCYPNPSSDYISLANLIRNSKIIVFDNMGKIVYQSEIASKEISIDVSQWNNGIYHVQLFNNNNLYAQLKFTVYH